MGLTVRSTGLHLVIEERSGAITSLRNTARDLELITGQPASLPCRVELAESGWVEGVRAFEHRTMANGVRLTWSLEQGIDVTSDILVRDEDLLLTVAAEQTGTATIMRIEYPVIGGIGRLGGPGIDELAHSHASGMLFHDPVDLLDADPENHRRLRHSPYPTGFAGATMQFLAYYGRGHGGFLVGTEDPTRGLKWLDVEGDGDALTVRIVHKTPVLRSGGGFSPGYPVVLAPLTDGSWHEAADRYRSWAIHQPWARPGPRRRWLREEVGIATFGISARHDRSPWLDAIHRMAGTPVFHVLGPDWVATGQDYHGNIPRGRTDWFPAVFHDANLRTIRASGDRWAPFEFDLLSADDPTPGEPVLASRMVHDPGETQVTDAGLLRFPLMCPATAYWHDFHVARDARLVTEHGPDALYYDISVNNVLLQCLADGHGHAPGSGEPIGSAFAAMYRDTGTAVDRAAGDHMPMGAEVMSEAFLDRFDFYQARAEAGPYGSFEGVPFRDWILDGRAEKIPLLTYVFGERAPLRMDGWAKLSAESGDLFYATAAGVLLNGGLLELNYEFSPLEDLDGHVDDPDQHYYHFPARHYRIDPGKAAFVGEIARARTGPANRYLARGRMLPAPDVDTSVVELDWYCYNAGTDHSVYETRGTLSVPSVLASAWRLDGRDAWLVANVLLREQEARVDGRSVVVPGRSIVFIEP